MTTRRWRTLLVAYEPGLKGNPGAVVDVLQSAPEWWHYLSCVWVIRSTEGPRAWTNKLHPHIKSGDRLFIVEVSPNYYGMLPPDAWDWLAAHVRKSLPEP